MLRLSSFDGDESSSDCLKAKPCCRVHMFRLWLLALHVCQRLSGRIVFVLHELDNDEWRGGGHIQLVIFYNIKTVT